jgi:PKD repeat protein
MFETNTTISEALESLPMSFNNPAQTTIIEPLERFTINYDNLAKGKQITWEWEIEKNLNAPSYVLSFSIEDSEDNKYYEIENYKDIGSFTVPFSDKWTLKWENTYQLDESYSSALELKYIVEILNQPPTASIIADKTSGPAELTVSFMGVGVDYDGKINSYYWDFGEGNTSNIQNPLHTFLNIGTYTVTLTVTDDDGATGEFTLIITVNNP